MGRDVSSPHAGDGGGRELIPLIRLGVQGTAVAVLLWNAARMVQTPMFWPFAAVLLLEAFWLTKSMRRLPQAVDTRWQVVLASSAIAVYPVLLTWLAPGPYVEPIWRFAMSYTLQFLALALQVWCLVSLRDRLTQLPEAHGLIQTGPYRYVRHPLYAAYGLAFLGTCVGVWQLKLWALFAGFVALEGYRAWAEERVLSRAFPAYRIYQRQTGMFVPRWSVIRGGGVRWTRGRTS